MDREFKVGDKVEIIKYGSIHWQNMEVDPRPIPKKFKILENRLKIKPFVWFDILPEIVGKQGVISKVSETGGYAIDGIPLKYAWYDKEQLKLIE